MPKRIKQILKAVPRVGSRSIRLSRWEGVKIAFAGIGGQAAAWVWNLATYATPDNVTAIQHQSGKIPALIGCLLSILYAASLFVNDTKKKP